MALYESGAMTCYNCGEQGHCWAGCEKGYNAALMHDKHQLNVDEQMFKNCQLKYKRARKSFGKAKWHSNSSQQRNNSGGGGAGRGSGSG